MRMILGFSLILCLFCSEAAQINLEYDPSDSTRYAKPIKPSLQPEYPGLLACLSQSKYRGFVLLGSHSANPGGISYNKRLVSEIEQDASLNVTLTHEVTSEEATVQFDWEGAALKHKHTSPWHSQLPDPGGSVFGCFGNVHGAWKWGRGSKQKYVYVTTNAQFTYKPEIYYFVRPNNQHMRPGAWTGSLPVSSLNTVGVMKITNYNGRNLLDLLNNIFADIRIKLTVAPHLAIQNFPSKVRMEAIPGVKEVVQQHRFQVHQNADLTVKMSCEHRENTMCAVSNRTNQIPLNVELSIGSIKRKMQPEIVEEFPLMDYYNTGILTFRADVLKGQPGGDYKGLITFEFKVSI